MPPEPKKSAHLQEVEADATRITQKRFDDLFAEQEYQKSKNNPVEEPEVEEVTVETPVAPLVEEPESVVQDMKGNKK